VGRFPQKPAVKGSQRWIQKLINDSPDLLNARIRSSFGFPESLDIEWRSPLASDEYAEYRDQPFTNLLDIPVRRTKLKDFRPKDRFSDS
jgi:hypothetical protein